MRISDWSSDVCSSDLDQIGELVVENTDKLADLIGRENGKTIADAKGEIGDRKRVVSGKSVSVRVDLGRRRIIKKNQIHEQQNSITKTNTTKHHTTTQRNQSQNNDTTSRHNKHK